MKKTIFLSGLTIALLVLVFQLVDHGLFMGVLSREVYVGIIAIICTSIGVWMGLKLTSPRIPKTKIQELGWSIDIKALSKAGISNREYEVLELMAKGLTNQEIADALFISLSTVKSHTSKIFSKLDAKRRTQAIRRAKELQLLP